MAKQEKETANEDVDLSTPGPMWRAKTKYGYNLDVVVSALQKAVRRGRTNEALFWGHELWTSSTAFPQGFPAWFWRRLLTIAHEDCGADPMTGVYVNAAMNNASFATDKFKRGVGTIMAAHAIIIMCRAPKSREACDAAMTVRAAKEQGWRIQPHEAAVDKHTATGRKQGKGKKHFKDEGRIVAGPIERNDFEHIFWGVKQTYVPRPDEDGGEPDVEIPTDKKSKRLFDGNGNGGFFADLEW